MKLTLEDRRIAQQALSYYAEYGFKAGETTEPFRSQMLDKIAIIRNKIAGLTPGQG